MYGSGAAPAGHDIRGHANMTPTGRVQINAYLDVNHYEESKMKKNPLYSGGSAGDVLTYSAFANEMALRRRYRQVRRQGSSRLLCKRSHLMFIL